MSARGLAGDVAGVLALGALLLLASPGVRVARADETPAAGAAPGSAPVAATGGSCRVGEAAPRRVDPGPVLRQLRQRLASEQRVAGAEGVALNGRGYNYRRARDPLADLAVIRAEALRTP